MTVLDSSTIVTVEGVSTKMSGNGLFSSGNIFRRWSIFSSVLLVTSKKFAKWLCLTSQFCSILIWNMRLRVGEKRIFPASFGRDRF